MRKRGASRAADMHVSVRQSVLVAPSASLLSLHSIPLHSIALFSSSSYRAGLNALTEFRLHCDRQCIAHISLSLSLSLSCSLLSSIMPCLGGGLAAPCICQLTQEQLTAVGVGPLGNCPPLANNGCGHPFNVHTAANAPPPPPAGQNTNKGTNRELAV
jgi:hypothetical protein